MVRNVGLNVDTIRLSGSLKNLRKELELLRSLEINLAEIPPAGLHFIFGGKLVFSKLKEVLEVIRDFPFEYTIHMPDPVNFAINREEDFEIASAVVEFAKIIDAKVIVYHCGSQPGIEGFDLEVQRLSLLADIIGDKNIFIGIENLDHDIEWTLNICKNVGKEKVKLTIDVGHLFLHCNGDVSKFIEQLELGLPYAVEIHFHDNFGKPANLCWKDIGEKIWFAYLYGVGDLHLPLGMGVLPLEITFELINKYFDGYVVIEINDLNRFQEDIANSIRLIRKNCFCG
ncbi:sugar phosphate isomerase/epimerase family protein [Pseudothermotoga thermarum]|uniref:Xylose isomerase domain-containing protein TIM barrel n=1 Tax=Pseudothermotoga thermarum DSM 5069 TaxID=688269 RepID=F7YY66_9THEM|nr:sugar phosphate isomerase/epimerase family protein [Pseudothermotoga thermarum]AEH50882.1 Xylose isomerase domain-containing protein TIM barrel [Pseudothermotoga thermarum DSM 5069]